MPQKVKCPICKQETPWEGNPLRPFCSERCRMQDLGNWASGQYTVPVEEFDSESELQETLKGLQKENNQ